MKCIKYILRLLIILFSVTLVVSCKEKPKKPVVHQKPDPPRYMYGIKTNLFEVIQDEIMRNKNLSEILLEAGLSSASVNEATQSCDSIFDVRKIKAGNPFTMLYDKKDTVKRPKYFIYEINEVDYLIFDFRDSTKMHVYKGHKNVTIQERRVKGVIETSLWNSMVDQGLSPNLAMQLSDIFAWTIDFFDLQKGDYFKVVFDEEFIESQSVGVKDLKYALFNHNGKDYYAIPFKQADGKVVFYEYNGDGMKKAFLKAPLKYSRISSYFSNARFHPVLRIVRPHHGVDYAAPTGTPVMTIGSGVVIQKGYSGGGGNTVKIKHDATYTTSYMHLSRYGSIHMGSRVQQGDIIGYVGSTGLATGPHLDFRVYKKGTAINPLTVVSPPADPVSKSRMPQFIHVRDSLTTILHSIK